ncbi:MAG: metal-dependent hydrolase [Planctomycetota bacterium]
MSTAFTHGVLALALGKACFVRAMPPRFWLLAAGCSALPDLDVVLHAFDVPWGGLWGHRGVFHSLPFAALVAVIVVSWPLRRLARPFSPGWWGLLAFFFVVTGSHGLLDAATDGGSGIAFLAPFDPARHFLPWRPLPVPPIGLPGFLTAYGMRVLGSEVLLVWLPLAVVVGAAVLVRRVRGRAAGGAA